MTVAVGVKVFDGIVLAADSATTIELGPPLGYHVYNSASKIFHLHRDVPIGAMTWGLGNVGSASIATLAKDLRRRLLGKDTSHKWKLGSNYTVEAVANRLVDMVFDELYQPALKGQKVGPEHLLGFLVAGYSAGSGQAEAWLVQMEDPTKRPTPEQVAKPDESGWFVYAQPEAVVRLLKGHDPSILDALKGDLNSAELAKVETALKKRVLERVAMSPAMPIADAIGFARYLVDTTVGYSRYVLGPDTVGGQVEIAGITRHEGFKWISRKHYYPSSLNPKDPGHDF
jgi:hypothetical protein